MRRISWINAVRMIMAGETDVACNSCDWCELRKTCDSNDNWWKNERRDNAKGFEVKHDKV